MAAEKSTKILQIVAFGEGVPNAAAGRYVDEANPSLMANDIAQRRTRRARPLWRFFTPTQFKRQHTS
jgi:hypothetical protein